MDLEHFRAKDLNGGIVGIADLVDCVEESNDPWFYGPYGFVLKRAKVLDFMPSKGQLRLYKPDATG